MSQEQHADGWLELVYSHQTLVIAVGVGLVIFAYFKPKLMFKFVGGVAILIVVVYVISFFVDLTSRGVQETTKFTDRPHTRIK